MESKYLVRDITHISGPPATGCPRFLIFGASGWIAGHLSRLLEEQEKEVYISTARLEDRDGITQAITLVRPTHVLNAAGCTGRPNVDWCEENKEKTIRSNVLGAINLTDVCFLNRIHCTHFSTGCIYEYDTAHPIGGAAFKEEDRPNFEGSFYSMSKARAEPILRAYDNCLVLRLRMPVSDDLHSRSFVTKILSYSRVVDIPNSHTILHDLLPAAIILAENSKTGVYNFTNPGAISHNEVLNLFKEIVRPSLEWQNFSLEEQAKILVAGRSNCALDATKLKRELKGYGYHLPEIREAYKQCFERMKANGVV